MGNSAGMISNILSDNTKLKGDFELDTILRIDGEFNGTIKSTSKVLVGEKGRAYCDIEAEAIEIGGVWEGNAKAKNVIKVYSSGRCKGAIEAPHIILEEGVHFNGNIKIVRNAK